MTDINSQLLKYSSVTLDEMDSVKLMNRIDTKYVFSINRLSSLLEQLHDSYKILEVNNKRQIKYVTTYLDTPEFYFFKQHVTGKLGRFKVRLRTYETGTASFLEVKNKTNKGRTVKSRIKTKENSEAENKREFDFMEEILPSDALDLYPALVNRFSRITLVSLESAERITIDFDLSFSGKNDENINLPFMAIAEIKRNKLNGASCFARSIKKMGIREMGFSKYCVGMALLYDVPKKNSIKPKILILNKLKDEFCTSAISG